MRSLMIVKIYHIYRNLATEIYTNFNLYQLSPPAGREGRKIFLDFG